MSILKFTIPVWLYLVLLCLTWIGAAPYYLLLLASMSFVERSLGEFSEAELRQELKFFYGSRPMQRIKLASALCFVAFNLALFCLLNAQNPQAWPFFALLLAAGYNNGTFLLSLAHEFAHATATSKRRLGNLLLFVLGLPFFRADHLYGHHEQVGTIQDEGSARFNQSFYSFLIHSFRQRIRRSYSRKSDLPRALKASVLSRNYLFTALLLAVGAGLLCINPLLLWFWLGQSALVYILYELTNYIQHYGLRRLPGEAVEMEHSWNSYFKYSNYVSWFLLVHSPHHVEQPLHKIRSLIGPRLPYSAYKMLLLALFPRLWFRVMNPLAARGQKSREQADKPSFPKPSVAGIQLTKNYDIYDTSV